MGFDATVNRRLLNKILESELKIKTHILSDLKHLTGWLYLAQQNKIQIAINEESGSVSAILFDDDDEPRHKIILAEFNPGMLGDGKFKNVANKQWMKES